MIDTGLGELFSAIKNNRKIAQIKYSFLSPELEDIYFIVPTYQEAKMISVLSGNNVEHTDHFVFEVLNQYIPIKSQLEWLLGKDTPAGLFISTYKSIVQASYPKDSFVVNQRLELARNNLNLFDSIFSILVNELKMNPETLRSMTFDEIIKTLAIGEKFLLDKELIEEHIEISGPRYIEPRPSNTIIDYYRMYGIEEGGEGYFSDTSNQMDTFEAIKQVQAEQLSKKRKYINFAEENKKLERALGPELTQELVRDDIDPYGAIMR